MLDKPKADHTVRLTRDDWIAAAMSALIEQGVKGVQITVLSRSIGVTRGSFYWHFKSRDDLLNALVDCWRRRNTNVIVTTVSGAETLDQGILALFAVWTDHRRFNPDLDQAVRDWARYDPNLRATLQAEDSARVTAVSLFFERFGYSQPDAFIRARVIYFTQISYYALGIAETEAFDQRISYLEAYVRCFTGRDINAGSADKYRELLTRGENPQ